MNSGRLIIPALRWSEETGFAHEARAIERALEFGAGGFILFGGTADSVSELTARVRDQAGRPLLFASDLERGPGQQFRGLDELPPPLAIASLDDPGVLRGAAVLTAVEARSVGVNWILAPVADLDLEPANPIVQTRAFAAAPEIAAAATAAWIIGCEAAGALACAKHFPGHGRTRSDSHLETPVVAADAGELRRTDLQPFQAAVHAGVSTVMTAHVAYPALDPTGAPATLSAPILNLLRDELGFTGLIVTDALMMAGAGAPGASESGALRALRAGVDLLLYPDDPGSVAAALAREVQTNRDLAARIEASLARYEGAVQEAGAADPPERPPPAGSAVALADWLIAAPLLRGDPPRLTAPLELVVVDDDAESRSPLVSTAFVRDLLLTRGVPLGGGGSRIVLAFTEPRGFKGWAGFGAESRSALAAAVPDSSLVVLFAHPRQLAALPAQVPVLLAWHRQRLMQEAVGRWLAERVG